MKILAIETSCDETAASVISFDDGILNVQSSIISSQVELHRQWGGVVPNLAGREHTKNIIPVLTETLENASISPEDIDLIAVTSGPGLIPALLIGTAAAKTLAFSWDKPLLGIHHIEGHIYANWLSPTGSETAVVPPQFPLIGLIVSGGHTQLVLMKDHITYEIIGETQDDAVGEAFDKVARLLGLSYPGGPEVSARALAYEKSHAPDAAFELPRPMLHSGDYNFSFSGIKTAVLYAVRAYQKDHSLTKDDTLPQEFVDEISFAFQQAVVDVLVAKTLTAAREHNVRSVILAGGVSANTQLREILGTTLREALPDVSYHIPDMDYCLDNAAMIAAAAAFRWHTMSDAQKIDTRDGWKNVVANPNMKMSSL